MKTCIKGVLAVGALFAQNKCFVSAAIVILALLDRKVFHVLRGCKLLHCVILMHDLVHRINS